MSSFKKLNKADITVASYAANKRWNLSYVCTPYSNSYINLYRGTFITGTFNSGNPSTDPVTNNQYERLIYDYINSTFYQSYTSSLNTGSLMFDVDTMNLLHKIDQLVLILIIISIHY